MAKFEIIVEETVILRHSIIVECEKEDLENIPDPDYGFWDIDDYVYSDELNEYAKVITVHEDDSYGDTQSFEITDIVPYKEESSQVSEEECNDR